jgi:hypothetical protein
VEAAGMTPRSGTRRPSLGPTRSGFLFLRLVVGRPPLRGAALSCCAPSPPVSALRLRSLARKGRALSANCITGTEARNLASQSNVIIYEAYGKENYSQRARPDGRGCRQAHGDQG